MAGLDLGFLPVGLRIKPFGVLGFWDYLLVPSREKGLPLIGLIFPSSLPRNSKIGVLGLGFRDLRYKVAGVDIAQP